MPECTKQKSTKTVEFSKLGRRVVEGRFDGGSMTSDGGVMFLSETDRKLVLTQAAARCIPDPRSPLRITHAVRDMLRQRVYGLALGWEDLKQRQIGEFSYAAQSWATERRVITRVEHGDGGNNPRYVVTHLEGDPAELYDGVYCQRGEAENRIKEAQVGLFATRTSCQQFQSNQLRMLLAALAYVLIERLRALALQGTALATAQVDTLRNKLSKLAL